MSTTEALRTITHNTLISSLEIRVFLCNAKQKHVCLQAYINGRYCSSNFKTNLRCVTLILTARWVWCPYSEKPFDLNHTNTTLQDSFTTHFTYKSFTLTAHVCSHDCVTDPTTTTQLVQFCFQLDRMLHSLGLIRSHTNQ